MRSSSSLAFAAMLLSGCAALPSTTYAQPLELSVAPSPMGAGNLVYVSPGGVAITDMGYTADGWMITTPDQLRTLGPSYAVRSGLKVRRGSYIPDWVETGAVENVSVSGLQPSGHYGYFVSPDQKAVIVDTGSRRVMRVLPIARP